MTSFIFYTELELVKFGPKAFHSNNKNIQYIFDGFTNVSWSSPTYSYECQSDNKTFLTESEIFPKDFNFTHPKDSFG
jgi:hypothetical protein